MDFFSQLDWVAILKIIGIDIMLGVDNAIVIALACAALPPEMRKRAVLWGTAGAVGLRAILLFFAAFLMAVPYVKFVAGAYLLYIGYKLLMQSEGEEEHNITKSDRVLGAIKTIIVADLMMSIDNVLAVTAASQSAGAHSTAYAIAGIVLSIPIIIFGAQGLMGLMEKYKFIVWIGAGLMGWVGAEMMISDALAAPVLAILDAHLGSYSHLTVKVTGFAAVVLSVLAAQKFKKPEPTAA